MKKLNFSGMSVKSKIIPTCSLMTLYRSSTVSFPFPLKSLHCVSIFPLTNQSEVTTAVTWPGLRQPQLTWSPSSPCRSCRRRLARAAAPGRAGPAGSPRSRGGAQTCARLYPSWAHFCPSFMGFRIQLQLSLSSQHDTNKLLLSCVLVIIYWTTEDTPYKSKKTLKY